MTIKPITRRVNRRKLTIIARSCCDQYTTDALDRAVARGPVTKRAVKLIARRCNDHHTTDALDALVH